MWVQDTVGVTVMDAWGQPSSAASVTVHSLPLDATSKAQAQLSSQTLQQGSSSGEYLYSTAHLHSHPGTYSYDPSPFPCPAPCPYVLGQTAAVLAVLLSVMLLCYGRTKLCSVYCASK